MLLAMMTLPCLLPGDFYEKISSVGDVFVRKLFFPKILTKGMCW